MAQDPQGLAYYPGVENLCSAFFTLNHGSSPSVATLYIPPQTTKPPKVGNLTFTYNGQNIPFPDCRLYKANKEVDGSGRELWVLSFFDTRWRWRFGRISGHYNVRLDTYKIDEKTLKPPQELFKLLLDEIRVKDYDVSQVPNDKFPERLWEYERCDHELDRLAEELKCRIVLCPGNKVRVLPENQGNQLPRDGLVTEGELGLESPELPSHLVYVAGRTLHQKDFELEAVAEEADGTIVKLDDVSYKPPVWGWSYFDPGKASTVTDRKLRELAKKWVYRGYRIKVPFDLFGERIDDLRRILPITSKQIFERLVDGKVENWPCKVFGIFHPGWSHSKNNSAEEYKDLKGHPNMVYDRGFSVDEDAGLILFAEPVYLYRPSPHAAYGNETKPAKLLLRTAVCLRDTDTHGWKHYEKERQLEKDSNAADRPLYTIGGEEIALKIVNLAQAGGGYVKKDNKTEVDKAANFALNQAQAALQWSDPASLTYAGLRPFIPDGAIQQISWIITEAGKAYTRASRNREDDSLSITLRQRQMDMYYRKLLDDRDKKDTGPTSRDPKRGKR